MWSKGVRSESIFEEDLLLCFGEEHFHRSLLTQRQSQEQRGQEELQSFVNANLPQGLIAFLTLFPSRQVRLKYL